MSVPGSSDTPEMATLRRVCYDRLKAGLPECQTALDSLVAALVAATERADEAEAEASRLLYERNETLTSNEWLGDRLKEADEARIATEARADQAERERDELRRHGGDWIVERATKAIAAAEARAAELEAALTEIARSGTDYSPGYGGSWASRVARHVLARGDAVGRGQ